MFFLANKKMCFLKKLINPIAILYVVKNLNYNTSHLIMEL